MKSVNIKNSLKISNLSFSKLNKHTHAQIEFNVEVLMFFFFFLIAYTVVEICLKEKVVERKSDKIKFSSDTSICMASLGGRYTLCNCNFEILLQNAIIGLNENKNETDGKFSLLV